MDARTGPGDVEEIVCRDLVEVVTGYLEREMDPHRHALVEEHLVICEGCREYVGHMRRTAGTLQALAAEALPDQRRSELLDAFDAWAKGRRS